MTGHAHHFSAAGRGHRDARLDAVIAPEPIAVGELPGTVEQVAVAVRRPVAPGPVLAEAEPDAGLDQGLHGQRSHRTGGDGDDGHVDVGQELDQLALARLVHSGQGEAVADRDVALHPARLHPFADQVELERPELAPVVQMDVDAPLVPLGQPEHLVEVAHGIPVDPGRVDAADEVGTIGESCVEQVESPRVTQDSRLGEGDDLDVGTALVGLAGRHDPVQALKLAVGVDLHVAADAGDAVLDHPGGRERRPIGHAGAGLTPVPAVILDELDQALARAVGAEGKAEPAGVEVRVRINETRQDNPAPAVDLDKLLEPRDGRVDADRLDATVDAQDVDRRVAWQAGPRPHIADQQPLAHPASLRSGCHPGGTPQLAIANAAPAIAITHEPGHMFITGLPADP